MEWERNCVPIHVVHDVYIELQVPGGEVMMMDPKKNIRINGVFREHGIPILFSNGS